MKQSAAPEFQGILTKLRASLPELSSDYGVRELGVFGSYVRGEQHEASDLDILVDFNEGAMVTMFRFARLEARLKAILGVDVDLVMRRALKPVIGERILAEVVLV